MSYSYQKPLLSAHGQSAALVLRQRGIVGQVQDAGGMDLVIDFDTTVRPDWAGLQICFFARDGIYEYSEYQAGPNEDELHIFGEYKTLNGALNALEKGKKKPIKIWDNTPATSPVPSLALRAKALLILQQQRLRLS